MAQPQLNFTITDHTTVGRSISRRLPLARVKDAVLGKRHSVSLVFIGERRARSLNRSYRKSSYPADVLSFPIAERESEIFICPAAAKRAAKMYGRAAPQHILFLFIHGLLHLKGMRHGSTMEREESRLFEMFSTSAFNGRR